MSMADRRQIPRMRPLEVRRLTAGEQALARIVFGTKTDFSAVKLRQLPKGLNFGAMVPLGQGILFSDWVAAADFTDSPVGEQGWFIHELAHVWQARAGMVLAAAKARALGARAYKVQLIPGKPFAAYNLEQQAELARFVFHGRTGRPLADAPPHAAVEALWPVPPL
jgi:hypothetical protein